VFILSGGQDVALVLLGVVLFGVGIGNVTSLPPLIAQAEFARADVPRAIALSTAISQATFAFAPAVFGALRELAPTPAGSESLLIFFVTAATIQLLAAAAYLSGRKSV
jgi:hypothetical protein